MKTFLDFGIHIPAGSTGEVSVLCPQCSAGRKKKTARCLSVNVEEGVWKCQHPHCNWTGCLGGKYLPPSKPILRPHSDSIEKIGTNVQDWLLKRGLSIETIAKERLGEKRGCLAIPFYKDSELVNVKYRDLKEKKFSQTKDCERIFYRFDHMSESGTIVITEGEIDALSLVEAGISGACSVPDGAPDPKSSSLDVKFSYLESAKLIFEKAKRIVIAVDSDDAGMKLKDELARRIGKTKCWHVIWPDDCKDANDVLLKHGKNVLVECVNDAKPFPLEGDFCVEDFYDRVVDLYNNGITRGVNPGWDTFFELFSVKTGELTVVTGIPGMGKSEFIDAMLVNIGKRYEWKFSVFSPENLPLECYVAKLSEKIIGKPFYGGANRMTPDERATASKWLNGRFRFCLPDEKNINLETILEIFEANVYRYGVRCCVIDPYNELNHIRRDGISETEYICGFLGKLRRFAKRFDVHMFLVAHPMKLKKNDLGKYDPPTPYDISGSAHFRNRADNCITVHRNLADGNEPVNIIVQKIRHKMTGRVGNIKLIYDYMTGIYSEV